jgi:hypothetical protein
MSEAPGRDAASRGGRTSWKRFALVALPAAAAVTGMLVAVGQGALAASFTISGAEAKISADSLDGTGFVQYGWVDQTARKDAVPVTTAAFKHAELKNMCQSVVVSLPLIGDLTLRINAGGGDEAVQADNLLVDLSHLEGDATFKNIEIGNDASKVNKGPANAKGFQDMFAQQADSVHIDNLRQNSYATSAGTFRLSGLNLNLNKGRNECY